ncbi:MAG: cobalamin-dependent protein, partial [Bacillota bacterium]
RLRQAVIFFDDEEMELAAKQWVEAGLDPHNAIFFGLVPGMEGVAKLYEDQVYFIPEMLLCTDVLYKGLGILEAEIKKGGISLKGKVLIGVVNGDIHDIGKNIVKMMLEISGFETYDLGRDVSLEDFKKNLTKVQPDIVCLSTMMTTTLLEMRKVITALKENKPGLKVLVGGAPVTEKIARRWGAAGYGKDAHHALRVAIDIMEQIKKEVALSAPDGKKGNNPSA